MVTGVNFQVENFETQYRDHTSRSAAVPSNFNDWSVFASTSHADRVRLTSKFIVVTSSNPSLESGAT